MYEIYAGGQKLHHPYYFSDGYLVLSPTLTMETNSHGSLSFLLPPTNPRYADIARRKTIITVKDGEDQIWRGRVISDEQLIDKKKRVYCEGEMSFFCDSVIRPYVFRGTVTQLFQALITAHNEQVDAERQFTAGVVDVNPDMRISRTTSAATSTWDALQEGLVNEFGGYIRVRTVGATHYVDYVASMSTTSPQSVEWGKNIIDITDAINAAGIITCLVPYGASVEPGDPDYVTPHRAIEDIIDIGTRFTPFNAYRRTIKSVNGGKDYLENADAIAAFGRVWGCMVWDSIDNAADLKSTGETYLQNRAAAASTITVNAIDYHLVDSGTPAIHEGDLVPVVSPPHGIRTTMICRKIVLPLMDLSKTRITLGTAVAAITNARSGVSAGGGNAAVIDVSGFELTANKVTTWRTQYDDTHYPSEKVLHEAIDYIGANFTRNPVLIYDKTEKLKVSGRITSGTDSANGLVSQSQGEGTSRDITSWNITGLDLSAFKSLRVVCRRNSANYGNNAEFRIPLDGSPTPTRNIFVNGSAVATHGDRNRLTCIICAVDADKSKFCVCQTFTLYGTAVTASNDLFVERIYGCYN